MKKSALKKATFNSLLRDQEVMDEIKNLDPKIFFPKLAEGLESTNESGAANLDRLLTSNEAPVGPVSGLEAIVKVTGRPVLFIQNDTFQKPDLESIGDRLEKHRAKIEKVIPSVARVDILNHADYDYVGTAWMIEEDVMITNRHVAEYFAYRQADRFVFDTTPFGRKLEVQVDFAQEYKSEKKAIEVPILEVLHMEKKVGGAPDFALLKVEPSSLLPKPIPFSSRKLSLNDQLDIVVIGYPDRDGRNNAFVMEELFQSTYQVKRLSPGRTSGSHPRGHIFMHDCTTLGGSSGSLVLDLESGKAIGLHYSGTFMENNFAVTSRTLLDRLANLRGRPQYSISTNNTSSGITGGNEAPPSRTDMAGKKGYNAQFLGEYEMEVSLPKLSPELQQQVAPVKGEDEPLLHYRHFSILMHKTRCMAIYTACNIDGNLLYGIPRRSDRWYYDPRMDKEYQAGQQLYDHNNIHRGHLVRRLDPAWGNSRKEAKEAIEDTFFWTNCTPQHRSFNPRSWLRLEDYILENANNENLKVTVFTGPVFAETDKIYRGYKIPEEYWKVVVVHNQQSDSLSATAYIVSQSDFMNNLEFAYGEFRTYHVPLRSVEEKTGLNFGLGAYDPLGSQESSPIRVIRDAKDIML